MNQLLLLVLLVFVFMYFNNNRKSAYVLPTYRYLDTEDEVALTKSYTSGRISEIFSYCSPESWKDCDYEKSAALNVGGIPNIPSVLI
jgi:hypothetical protein